MAAVTGRYARAFAEVTAGHKLPPDKMVAELEQMAALVESSAELRNVLANPAVEHRQKISLLDAIVKRMGADRLLRNFVAVLIDKKRIVQIGEIAAQFKQDLDARMGIADARVSSARKLSEAERKSLERQLAEITGKSVRATYAEEAGLLGGAVVRIGSTIYDGSVRGRLQKIKEEIVGS
jgi:F-type H+-transporting ATPase subunit delta